MTPQSSSGKKETGANDDRHQSTRRTDSTYEIVGPEPSTIDSDFSFMKTHGRGRLHRSKSKWTTHQEKWNYLQHFYSDHYRQLLKEAADLPSQKLEEAVSERLDPSQIGSVLWTSAEKMNLFDSLARRGRFDLSAISVASGSKSVVEIQAYLRELHDSMTESRYLRHHEAGFMVAEIPAAVQISSKVERLLEKASDALCMYQEQYENVAGRKAHGEYWLTDRSTALAYERDLNSEVGSQGRDHVPFPAIDFFHLPEFFELSENVFMNQSNPTSEHNWRKLAISGERPAATYDCLADLYNIVVSLTRRLIQTTMFITKARLRAHRHEKYGPANLVKFQDAVAAINVLKLERDSFNRWRAAPRRCGLWVIELRHGRGYTKAPLTYEEIETALARRSAKRRGRYQDFDISEGLTSSEEAAEDIEDDDSMESDKISEIDDEDNNYSESENSSPLSRQSPSDQLGSEEDISYQIVDDEDSERSVDISTHPSSSMKRKYDELQMERQREIYAEQTDLIASNAEEARLLRRLGHFSEPGIGRDASRSSAEKQSFPPKNEDQGVDWNETFSPRHEWEDHTEPMRSDFFAHTLQERKRFKMHAEPFDGNGKYELLSHDGEVDHNDTSDLLEVMETECLDVTIGEDK